ncbi:MAG: helix-hairpin-helix domain-containing protein [Clostridiales bacterium]|nr:helix-hairpin-helix domain-containing protein [Clostridiales bacterium]
MSMKTGKLKTFLYPAAFVLIAGFAFAYKFVLKGNAGYIVRTVRGGEENVVIAESSSETFIKETFAADSSAASSSTASTVQVYVCGAVRNPGVYSVVAGTILNDAVEKAGGFTEDAAVANLNLVFVINSNASFYIPTVKEVESGLADGSEVIRGKGTFIWGGEGSASDKAPAKVNINTADLATLQTLPGIGEATARSIIEYRSRTPFKKPEDLKKVSGIGDAKFERVKAFVTV